MSDGGLAGFLVFSSKNIQKAEGASNCRALLVERISMSLARRYFQPPARTSQCMRLAASSGESFPVSRSSAIHWVRARASRLRRLNHPGAQRLPREYWLVGRPRLAGERQLLKHHADLQSQLVSLEARLRDTWNVESDAS